MAATSSSERRAVTAVGLGARVAGWALGVAALLLVLAGVAFLIEVTQTSAATTVGASTPAPEHGFGWVYGLSTSALAVGVPALLVRRRAHRRGAR